MSDTIRTTGELKAEPMTTAQLERWLKGRIPRRVLVVPFGGPIPSDRSPRGVDLDGEWFSESTDLFDGHKALLDTRERLVDWHHDLDPTGVMKGAILGRVVMDATPEAEGYWADYWANAGERRTRLVAALEERGTKLYGSSEAAYKKASATGEILVWPLIRHTITTSPQNTLAVVPPLKALLADESLPLDEIGFAALKAALLGLEPTLRDLRATFQASSEDDGPTFPSGSETAASDVRLSVDQIAQLREVLERAERRLRS